jgi:hypothetical protein
MALGRHASNSHAFMLPWACKSNSLFMMYNSGLCVSTEELVSGILSMLQGSFDVDVGCKGYSS